MHPNPFSCVVSGLSDVARRGEQPPYGLFFPFFPFFWPPHLRAPGELQGCRSPIGGPERPYGQRSDTTGQEGPLDTYEHIRSPQLGVVAGYRSRDLHKDLHKDIRKDIHKDTHKEKTR